VSIFQLTAPTTPPQTGGTFADPKRFRALPAKCTASGETMWHVGLVRELYRGLGDDADDVTTLSCTITSRSMAEMRDDDEPYRDSVHVRHDAESLRLTAWKVLGYRAIQLAPLAVLRDRVLTVGEWVSVHPDAADR
jgi:hypothetical protein